MLLDTNSSADDRGWGLYVRFQFGPLVRVASIRSLRPSADFLLKARIWLHGFGSGVFGYDVGRRAEAVPDRYRGTPYATPLVRGPHQRGRFDGQRIALSRE